MRIEVDRYSSGKESTLSLIFIDGVFECYGLEDEYREVKIKGETRIPDGEYAIKVRAYGGTHEKYKRYPFHKGMLQVANVLGFEHILIHKGNTDDHTAGCLLVGDTVNNNLIKEGFLGSSAVAYERFYKKVIDSALKGELSIAYTSR